MENTSGFYKESEDGWMYAPHFVEAPNYILLIEYKDTYSYPVDGWYWFENAPSEYLVWKLNNK
jgi:hypothetical protein